MKDYLTFTSDSVPAGARVLGFRGHEGLSKLFNFEIYVTMSSDDSADFDMAKAIAQPASLKLDRGDSTEPMHFHGVLAGIEDMMEVHDSRAIYRLTLVPKFWLLTQSHHSRLYTAKSATDVIKDVFKKAGLETDEYTLKLEGSLSPEEHICQYHESDFDFVSRWMEREGLYYYFDHGDSKAKLVITDNKASHDSLRKKAVPYRPTIGKDRSSGEAFHAFACRQVSLPGSVKLKDYDHVKPTLEVSGTATVGTAHKGEISVHSHRFFTPGDGKRMADIHAKQLLAKQVTFTGTGGVTHIRSGYLFEIEEHPRAALNQKYLVVEMEHFGNQETSDQLQKMIGLEGYDGYTIHISAVTSEIQFRAHPITHWPRIFGIEHAIVDGPADSDYAQIDKHGRYNVKFHFDETDLKDGKATTWLRMMQPHAGNPEGFHFPLRKGTEVIVVFLGGDPDRPVIAGAVPNTNNPSPVTSSNNTQNVIQTGGLTRIEIEDKDGSQYIDISTPPEKTFLHMGVHAGLGDHNWVLKTDGDGSIYTGGNRDIFVGGDQTEHVVGDVEENYDSDQDTVVAGDQTLEVDGDCDEEIGGDQTLEVGGDLDEEIGGDQTLEVGGDLDEEIGGDQTLEVGGDQSIEITGDQSLEVTGDVAWDVTGDVKIECNEWSVEQKSEVSWSNLGNIKHVHAANKLEVTMGTVTEAHLGLKSEMLVGGSIEVTVAAAAELFVGAKAEITVAAQFECNVGPKAEAKTAKVKAEEAAAEKIEARIAQCEADMLDVGAYLIKHEIRLIAGNMMIFK